MPPRQRQSQTNNKPVNVEDKNKKSASTEGFQKDQDSYKISWKRIVTRFFLIIGMALFANWYLAQQSEITFVSVSDFVKQKSVEVPCSKDYVPELELYRECVPKRCGRAVMDDVVTKEQAQQLLRTAKAGLAKGGSNGGASILDLHSGALSHGDKFINIYNIIQSSNESIFSENDFKLYSNVKNKIHSAIATHFNVPKEKLFLTSPTFFSRMTTTPAKTVHDEYWHVHIDKETYGSFHYTSLLYLTDYGTDFEGGRFIFTDGDHNTTVEPRQGRVSFFTSGSENPHFVEKVKRGTRYAITVSFSCDPRKGIQNPSLPQHS